MKIRSFLQISFQSRETTEYVYFENDPSTLAENFFLSSETRVSQPKKISNLLLLSMFAIASRYSESVSTRSNAEDETVDEMGQGGSEYFSAACESLGALKLKFLYPFLFLTT